MKYFARIVALVILSTLFAACEQVLSDRTAPVIRDITTSTKVVVISDCQNASVIITGKVTDDSKVNQVLLWYRVNQTGPFTSANMKGENDPYSAEVKGTELQGNGYGPMEVYVTAQDDAGNKSESPRDASVQFRPCVSN